MHEEQRRQAAAQRCADLANRNSEAKSYIPLDFLCADGGAFAALLEQTLNLDELARKAIETHGDCAIFARKHILPEPKLSPVERLAKQYQISDQHLRLSLADLGLELREKSDD